MSNPKFRIWNKQKNSWGVKDFHLIGEVMLLQGFPLSELNNLEINQYTGLKDKNGKDIYEGDIVKGISYPAVCEVVFNDGSFWLIAKDWENTLGGMSADCEVIGNIWENGDLLKRESNE